MRELNDKSVVKTTIPSVDIFLYDVGDLIKEQRSSGIIQSQSYPEKSGSVFMVFLPYIVIMVLFGAFWFFIISKQQGGGAGMSFGKSKAKLFTPTDGKKVTFEDVAGADEEKEELKDSNEDLWNRLKENENLLRKAKDLIQSLQADLQLSKIENSPPIKEHFKMQQDNNIMLEAENKELAAMCQDKELELAKLREENLRLIEELECTREELDIARNDRVHLQEELSQSLQLLEEKDEADDEELKQKLQKKTIQLKEAREAFGILVFIDY